MPPKAKTEATTTQEPKEGEEPKIETPATGQDVDSLPPASEELENPEPIRVIDEDEAANIVREHESQGAPEGVINDRKTLIELEEKSVEFNLSRIIGGRITGASVRVDQGLKENVYGLNITVESIQGPDRKLVVWIMADPEGNGPGHLDIEE